MDLLFATLTLVTFFPLVGVLVILLLPRGATKAVRWTALLASLATFGLSLAMLGQFDAANPDILLLEVGMVGVFLALDLFLFYIFWEFTLVPMYFLIGIWGGPRRMYAAVKFFLYTMAGSILMLLAIVWLGLPPGPLSVPALVGGGGAAG